MEEKFLELTGITKNFFGVKALDNVDFSINKGETCCLVGENGSGKSTLIKIIAGVYPIDSGQIMINGKAFPHLSPREAIQQGIQIIYQDFSLFSNLTVAENIVINRPILQNKKIMKWKEVKALAKNALERINVEIDLDAEVGHLSVAQKQLIAISRALSDEAKLIIMDEPTTALTNKEISVLYSVIEDLKKHGVSIVFVSHKLDEVVEVSEKIVILRNGKKVISSDTADFDRNKLVYYMIGREIEDTPYQYQKKDSAPLLSVKEYTLENSFRNISFDLYPGEILGITGLLGCGRTELAKSLFGIKPADSGQLFINGRETRIKSVEDAIANKIAYVPEDRLVEGLFLEQSIGNNMVSSVTDRLVRKRLLIDLSAMREMVDEFIDKFKIATPSASLPVKNLSGGNQQRVVLSKWLTTDPEILILNCPTVGVDVGSKKEIHDIIKDLGAEGYGVIVITDDIPELFNICSHVIIMSNGEIASRLLVSETNEKYVSESLGSEVKN